MLLPPASAAELSALQLAGRREAVEKARRSKLLAPRLSSIRSERLEDDWTKIPLLTKEELRDSNCDPDPEFLTPNSVYFILQSCTYASPWSLNTVPRTLL